MRLQCQQKMTNSNIIKPIPQANQLVKIWRNYGNNTYPINVKNIIDGFVNQKFSNEKLTIYSQKLDSIEGALIKSENSNEWSLLYNSNIVNTGRQNFTIAHELGHYLCHRSLQNSFNCGDKEFYQSSLELEKDANIFASYLLMPIDDFKVEIEGQIIDFDIFKHCADKYQTSLIATIIKWLEFTTEYGVFIVSVDDFVLWSRSSNSIYKKGIYFKSGTELPKESIVVQKKDYTFLENHILKSGVWNAKYPVKEFSFHSESYDKTFTLLIYQDIEDGYFDKEEEQEDCTTYFNRFSTR